MESADLLLLVVVSAAGKKFESDFINIYMRDLLAGTCRLCYMCPADYSDFKGHMPHKIKII
jgi:hypothetical protein